MGKKNLFFSTIEECCCINAKNIKVLTITGELYFCVTAITFDNEKYDLTVPNENYEKVLILFEEYQNDLLGLE